MNILDENIPKDQRELLERGRSHIRQIGFNVGRRGMKDEEEIIPFLLRQHRPTFFTRDDDFYKPRLCHAKYGLIYLAIEKKRSCQLCAPSAASSGI